MLVEEWGKEVVEEIVEVWEDMCLSGSQSCHYQHFMCMWAEATGTISTGEAGVVIFMVEEALIYVSMIRFNDGGEDGAHNVSSRLVVAGGGGAGYGGGGYGGYSGAGGAGGGLVGATGTSSSYHQYNGQGGSRNQTDTVYSHCLLSGEFFRAGECDCDCKHSSSPTVSGFSDYQHYFHGTACYYQCL